jgi:tRNA-dihydrouridine synthase 1
LGLPQETAKEGHFGA